MHPKLFIPGPTEVEEDVLRELSRPIIGHRFPEASELYREVVESTKEFFETPDYHVFVVTSSGTGLMEGAIRNLVKRKVLCVVNGAFSERWYKIALANGKEAVPLEVPWGKAVKPEQLDEALSNGDFEAVTIVQNETSTGVRNPIEKLAPVAHEHGALVLVDAVSSLGGDWFDIQGLGLDAVVSSSQKAMALPPGLSILFLSERAMKKAEEVENRGYYFDFLLYKKYWDRGYQTPTTPAISLLYAYRLQIRRMLEEGRIRRYERHVRMAEMVRNWALRRGLGLFAERGYESVTLTTIRNTLGVDVPALNQALRERGYVISNGYGRLKNVTFRIAHMGELTPGDVASLLANIDDVMGWG